MRINGALRQLDQMRYPMTVEEVVLALGDPAIELAGGSQQVSAVFASVDIDSVSNADEAKLLLLSGLEVAAIGRKGYSDRDPPASLERRIDMVAF